MKTNDFDTIQANSGNDLIVKITRERIKKIVKPDCNKMVSLYVPSQRATFYCKNQERAKKRIKELIKEYPGIEIIQKKPIK